MPRAVRSAPSSSGRPSAKTSSACTATSDRPLPSVSAWRKRRPARWPRTEVTTPARRQLLAAGVFRRPSGRLFLLARHQGGAAWGRQAFDGLAVVVRVEEVAQRLVAHPL